MHKIIVPALVGAVLSVALAGSAQALNARTWISGTGVDQAGCGPIASPCRTLQFAHDQTNAGGEINFKDSAGYGGVVITKAINIIADGVLAGVLAAPGSNAITINAGANDAVILRGLTIEGANVGKNGVVFNSGAQLDIAACLIQNFAGTIPDGTGIYLQPTSGSSRFTIVNTTSSHNTNNGLAYRVFSGNPAAQITLNHATFVGNANDGGFFSSSSTSPITVSIFNSLATGNANDGFTFNGPVMKVDIDNSVSSANGRHGYIISGSGTSAVIGRSVSSHNSGFGIIQLSSTIVSSFKNNQLFDNGSGVTSGVIGTATFN